MWNREQLKQLAKQDFQKNYWYCVLVAVIASICLGEFKLNINIVDVWKGLSFPFSFDYFNLYDWTKNAIASSVNAFSTIGLFGSLSSILLLKPVYVGTRRFFLANIYTTEKPDLSLIFYAFKTNYGNVVLTMFLKRLFIALWSLLLIIPGIIKGYSYYMVDYLLADNPNMDYRRAFEISQRTMEGEKMNTFVLDLSFILWYLGVALTAGILGVFYVYPYVTATKTRLYDALKQKALQQGIMSYQDIN